MEEISFQVSVAGVDPVKVSSNFLMQTKYSFLPYHFSTNMNRIQSPDERLCSYETSENSSATCAEIRPPPKKKNLKKWIKMEKQNKGRWNTLRDGGSGPCFKVYTRSVNKVMRLPAYRTIWQYCGLALHMKVR